VPKKKTSQVNVAADQPVDTETITTSRQPVISCARCEWTRGYDPDATTASDVLTGHYNRDHAAELASA
jgi:hypothetical protein